MSQPMLSRRRLLGVAGAVAVGYGATACTGVSSAPSGPSSGGGSKSLRLFTYEDDSTIGLLKKQVKKFDQEHGTTTAVDSLPGSGAAVYPDKLRTELLGGKGPDLWRIWGGEIGRPFATAKQAADLAPYYQKYGWDKLISSNAVDGMTFNGVKSGVPLIASAIGCWYSKAAFKKAKINTAPTSYAELEDANQKLVAAGITPCGLGGKYGWDLMRLFEYLLEQAVGPQVHDQLLVGKASWDQDGVVMAFTNFLKWQQKKWLPDGALGLDPSDIEPAYVQGKTAYTLTGTWTEVQAIKTSGKPDSDFGTFQLPTGQSPLRHSGFVEGYMINNHSASKGHAAELLNFLTQPDTQKALQNTSSTVAGAEPDKSKLPLAYQWSQINKKSPFYTIQDQAFPKQQADQYFTVQSDLLQQKITPAAAAKKMQKVVSDWVKG